MTFLKKWIGCLRRSRLFSQLLMAAFGASLMACANPAAATKAEAESFQKKFPDHFQTVDVGGMKTHFVWSGDPHLRPLLFVHGSPGAWDGWAHFLTDDKLQKSFQVIVVDRPGYGGSNAGISESSLQKQAERIVAALDINQSGRPAILVGHSFGGPVIAQMAIMFPERVAGLVFVASSVSPDLEKTKWYQYPATWWPFRAIIPSALRVCNEEILALKKELSRILPDWSKISAKAVLIQGQDDPLVPPGNLDFLVAHLNPAQIVAIERVPGLNHFVPWKRPDLIFNGIWKLESALSK